MEIKTKYRIKEDIYEDKTEFIPQYSKDGGGKCFYCNKLNDKPFDTYEEALENLNLFKDKQKPIPIKTKIHKIK